jgi:two-component system sensor histidine kinase KdpD
VAHIVVGRSLQPWWRQVLFGSVPLTLLREARDADVHVVAFEDEP